MRNKCGRMLSMILILALVFTSVDISAFAKSYEIYEETEGKEYTGEENASEAVAVDSDYEEITGEGIDSLEENNYDDEEVFSKEKDTDCEEVTSAEETGINYDEDVLSVEEKDNTSEEDSSVEESAMEVTEDIITVEENSISLEADLLTEEEEEILEAGSYGLSNPRTSDGKVTWDCVWFGNYYQKDTNGDGKADTSDKNEPIKWRVLSVDGDDAFLLADYALDCQPYNTTFTDITWETCTLRSWLNGYGASSNTYGTDYSSNSFIGKAFSSSEQSAIIKTTIENADNPNYGTEGGNNTSDKVFLLSLADVANTKYGFSSYQTESDPARWSKASDYAEAQGVWISNDTDEDYVKYNGNCWWWLRSPGSGSYDAATVASDGWAYACGILGYYVDRVFYAVRPALHLNLSSSTVWSKAGTVTSDGTASETAPGTGGGEKPPVNPPKTDGTIQDNISKLGQLLDGRYFNTNAGDVCGEKSKGHACSDCEVKNVLKANWCKEMFGDVNIAKLPNGNNSPRNAVNAYGRSCMGFAAFALWYAISGGDINKSVTVYKVGQFTFNKKQIQQYVQAGDAIRVNGHSFVVKSVNEDTISIIQSNSGGDYNCQVSEKDLKYTGTYSGMTFNLARANGLVDDKNLKYQGTVNCPVDVTIYDEDEIIGQIVDNIVTVETENATMVVDGDSKIFYIPTDINYRIELTGNDSGTMDYSLSLLDLNSGEMERVFYDDLELKAGQVYTEEIVDNSQLDELVLLNDEDEIVEITNVLSKDDLNSLEVSVEIEGDGVVFGDGNYSEGDYVTLYAEANDTAVFKGWFNQDDECISKDATYCFDAESITLKAVFESKLYTVSYNSVSNCKIELVLENKTISSNNLTLKAGSMVQVNIYPDEGYIIETIKVNGKNQEVASVMELSSISENVLIEVTCKKGNVAVSLNAAGGQLSDKTITVLVGSIYGELPIPVKTGYSFIGWFTEETGGEQIKKETLVTNEKAHTLYAHWKALEYTIIFDAQDGTILASNNEIAVSKNGMAATKKVSANEAYGELPNAEKNYHEFLGWFTEKEAGEQIKETSKVSLSENQILYAHWKSMGYPVILDINGGEFTSTSDKLNYSSDRQKATIIVKPKETVGIMPFVKRAGYIFAGWKTEDGRIIKLGDISSEVITKETTYVATWSYLDVCVKDKVELKLFLSQSTLGNKYQVKQNGTLTKAYGTVSKSGYFTPKKTGTVVIESLNDKGEVIDFVNVNIHKPSFDKKAVPIITKENQTLDLSTYLIDAPTNTYTVYWETKSKLGSVDNKGVVKAGAKSGKMTVTATFSMSGGKKIKVSVPVTIKLPKHSTKTVTVTATKSKALAVTNLVGQNVTWKSENPAIATVTPSDKSTAKSAKAVVTGVTPGPVTIIANVDGVDYTFDVVVK